MVNAWIALSAENGDTAPHMIWPANASLSAIRAGSNLISWTGGEHE